MWKDLIFAVRTLRRNPLFAVVATISLALGIGATTAIFSLLDQVLLRALPVQDPGRLVLLHREFNPNGSSTSDNFESVFSYPMYRQLRDLDPAFAGTIARAGASVALSWHGETQASSAEVVSGNFFETLGVSAAIGRVLKPEDDGKPGANPVAVLGHSYWASRFGSDPSIVNQTITINGHPVLVIGVASTDFRGLRSGSTPDLYVPIAMQKAVKPTFDVMEDPQFYWLNVFARLKPGFELQKAQAATDVAYRSILESELARLSKPPSERGRQQILNHHVELRMASQGINELRRQWEKPLIAVMAMVCLVLLITCSNVAGLMLARATGRQREIAIRLALGASRGALVKQLLTEGMVLFLAASILGLLGAVWSSQALISILPNDFSGDWLQATLNFRLFAFNLAVAAVCGLFFGLVPALQATRPAIAATLKDQAGNISSAGGAARLRKIMATAQVAFSLTLLAGAGLFAKSLFQLMKVDLGFRTERLIAISIDVTPSRPDLPGALTFYRDLQERLGSVNGVVNAAASNAGPFSNTNQGGNITVEGYKAAENEDTGSQFAAVSPGFFHALGIPLTTGREFSDRDQNGAPKTIVVNEAFVKRYFGTQNPIGRMMMFGGGNHPVFDRQIVGVVADSHKDVRTAPTETIYFPYLQWEKPERLQFYVRTRGDEKALGSAVRSLVRTLDPNAAVGDPEPLTLLIRNSIYTDRLIAILSVAFGVLATLLAAIGLYGVIGYAVARRTPELGIRMALGALPADVLRLVLQEAAGMVGIGIVIGIAGGLGLGRFVESQLFGMKASDPSMLGAAVIVLSLVAAAAAFVPAWRASKIDPLRALKYE